MFPQRSFHQSDETLPLKRTSAFFAEADPRFASKVIIVTLMTDSLSKRAPDLKEIR
jgi:hypothetical protein